MQHSVKNQSENNEAINKAIRMLIGILFFLSYISILKIDTALTIFYSIQPLIYKRFDSKNGVR